MNPEKLRRLQEKERKKKLFEREERKNYIDRDTIRKRRKNV